jgi:hypothetical protein
MTNGKVSSIRFMREHIKSIRVYNEPNFYRLWMYGLIFLVVVIGLVAFVAVLRRR